MARYTNLFTTTAADSVPELKVALAETLKSCDLNLIYEAQDYLVAKEKPGQVSYAKLATIEVLINPPLAGQHEARVNLVVKNEELPLSNNNHCQRVFQLVNQAIRATNSWQFT
ncbi:MAG: hypothetical protein AAF215_27520 [Cyanobacteria bacterium P01_A01_bin.123]